RVGRAWDDGRREPTGVKSFPRRAQANGPANFAGPCPRRGPVNGSGNFPAPLPLHGSHLRMAWWCRFGTTMACPREAYGAATVAAPWASPRHGGRHIPPTGPGGSPGGGGTRRAAPPQARHRGRPPGTVGGNFLPPCQGFRPERLACVVINGSAHFADPFSSPGRDRAARTLLSFRSPVAVR